MFRYKLKECKENEGFTAKVVCGVKLVKDSWYTSPQRSDKLEKFASLIDFEAFDEQQELKDKIKKEIASGNKSTEPIIEKLEKNPYDARSLDTIEIQEKLSRPQIIDQLMKLDPVSFPNQKVFNGKKRDELAMTLINLKRSR